MSTFAKIKVDLNFQGSGDVLLACPTMVDRNKALYHC
jgi:hypothetical protein